MKTTKEILIDIRKTEKAIKKCKELDDAMRAELNDIREQLNGSNNKKSLWAETEPRRDQLHIEQAKNSEKMHLQKVVKKILETNYRYALFMEAAPGIIEVLEKYNGRPYGEKTEEKIRNEIKEKTGCTFFVNHRYSWGDEICIYDDYTQYARDNSITVKNLLIDNKINAPELDDMTINYCKYIDDPKKRALELKKAYNKAKAKQEELEKACSDYNGLITGNMEPIYTEKYLYTGDWGR